DGVALAMEIAHDRHEKSLARKAGLHQKFALIECVDLAITLAIHWIVPVIDHCAPMIKIAHRHNIGVDLAINSIKDTPDPGRQNNIHRRQSGYFALLRTAAAKVNPAMRNMSRSSNGDITRWGNERAERFWRCVLSDRRCAGRDRLLCQ